MKVLKGVAVFCRKVVAAVLAPLAMREYLRAGAGAGAGGGGMAAFGTSNPKKPHGARKGGMERSSAEGRATALHEPAQPVCIRVPNPTRATYWLQSSMLEDALAGTTVMARKNVMFILRSEHCVCNRVGRQVRVEAGAEAPTRLAPQRLPLGTHLHVQQAVCPRWHVFAHPPRQATSLWQAPMHLVIGLLRKAHISCCSSYAALIPAGGMPHARYPPG